MMHYPDSYPSKYTKKITIQNGIDLTLRPIVPEDAERLQEGFKRLSKDTIYYRFLDIFSELSNEQAKHFATVDYHQRMAIVASRGTGGEERLVAVARYEMINSDIPRLADAAIVVSDDYQGLGLGSQMMSYLVDYAQEHGVHAFQVDILMSNFRIQQFIQKSALPYEKKMSEPGMWKILIKLKIPD